MGRRKKPIVPPPPPDPLAGWGDVATDHRSERKRLASIVARNGRRIASYRVFCRALGRACHEANAALYELMRCDPTTVSAELKNLAHALADVHLTLDSLGADATNALHNRAVQDEARPAGDNGETPWRWLEPPDYACGEGRVGWVRRLLEDCQRWATEAGASYKRRAGRPTGAVGKLLVEQLAELWQAQTGQKPTISTDAHSGRKSGDFLEFCQAVIEPIWSKRGAKVPSVKDLAQSVLYPRPATAP